VRVRADEELTVEVRAADSRQCRSDQLRMQFANSAAGEGETGAEFDALMPAGLVLAMGALTLALGVLTLVTGA